MPRFSGADHGARQKWGADPTHRVAQADAEDKCHSTTVPRG